MVLPRGIGEGDPGHVTRIAEEFILLHQSGKAGDLDAFCARYPEVLRARIREACVQLMLITGVIPEYARLGVGHKLGSYEILAPLGRGGMGEVYRARDPKLGREIAIKVLPSELACQPERVKWFKREAKAIAALDHPNIVTVHSVEESDGLHFMTMQLVQGKTLSELIPKKGVSLDKLFDLAIPLADAVSSAHEGGVIHRDLKPANIMVTADGRVEILDFGLARLRPPVTADRTNHNPISSLTDEVQIVGTVAYMSPEQAGGGKVDHRTDIFSLGIILYEMVTGQRPFKGDTPVALMSSIMKDTPTTVIEQKPWLPRHLGRIVRRCLAKDVAQRYQTAADVRNELIALKREVESGELASAREGGPTARAGPRRWAVAAAGVVVLVLVGLWVSGGFEDDVPLVAVQFEKAGDDPDTETFVNGLREFLIMRLSAVPQLRVLGGRIDPTWTTEEIAETLHASMVLRVRASTFRVTAQLLDASGDNLWGPPFQEDIAIPNMFDVLEGLVLRIANLLGGEMNRDQLPVLPTTDPHAYEAYVRGRDIFDLTPAALDLCLSNLEDAVRRDNGFALAYSAMADVYLAKEFIGDMDLKEAVERAREATQMALDINPDLAEAQGALGHILLHERKGPETEDTFRKALDLKPSYQEGWMFLSTVLLDWGRLDDAVDPARSALEIGRLSPYGIVGQGLVQLAQKEYRAAADSFEHAIVLRDSWWWHYELAWALSGLGDHDGALREIEKTGELAQGALADEFGLAPTRVAFQVLAGELEASEARARLAELERTTNAGFAMGLAYAVLGDVDLAFDWWLNRTQWTILLPTHFRYGPLLEGIREDPRYDQVLEGIDAQWGWR